MARFGKYRSTNEVYDAYYGVPILTRLEGVLENLQMLRRDFKKPKDERLDDYLFDIHLKDNLVGLNKIIKQLKRNKKKH